MAVEEAVKLRLMGIPVITVDGLGISRRIYHPKIGCTRSSNIHSFRHRRPKRRGSTLQERSCASAATGRKFVAAKGTILNG